MRQHFHDAGASATAPFRVSDRQGANPSLPLRQNKITTFLGGFFILRII